MLKKQQKHIKRRKRVRAKISGTNSVPRFSVFRSNKNIYAQLIDDEKGKTLVAASDKELKNLKEEKKENKKEIIRTGKILVAYEIGKLIAGKAIKKDIKKVVFDRGGNKYHGRVKAIAEGAREGGLKF
jgi:large subunit ribosomal protein L18